MPHTFNILEPIQLTNIFLQLVTAYYQISWKNNSFLMKSSWYLIVRVYNTNSGTIISKLLSLSHIKWCFFLLKMCKCFDIFVTVTPANWDFKHSWENTLKNIQPLTSDYIQLLNTPYVSWVIWENKTHPWNAASLLDF